VGRESRYTRSRDLVNWEPQMMVDVMGPGHWQPEEREHTARNAWAPDISVDEKTGRLVVVWASTVKGEFASTAESSENGCVVSAMLSALECVGGRWCPGAFQASLPER
jgi:beta-xylosidase